jgi:fatty-acyl-CoA synthase
MDLSDLIDRNAAFTPDKAAIHFEGRTLSFSAFHDRIAQTARGLKSEFGVGRGDRVAILAANHADYLVLLYACARLGAMLVTLNWRLAIPEQLFILSDSGAKVLVVDREFSAVVSQLAAALPDIKVVGLDFSPDRAASFDDLISAGSGDGRNPHTDTSNPLLLVYTSGTTGRPKGAVLRQEALIWNAAMSHHLHDMRSDDHILTVLPMFHVGGINIQTTPALQIGATVTVHTRFTPDAMLKALAEDRPTLVLMVPAVMQAVLQHPQWSSTDISSLRAVSTGSAQVPVPLIEGFERRGLPVLQVYGSTETGPVSVYTRLGGDLSRKTSTGLPGLYCEAKVVDNDGREVPHGTAGEVVVRGPNVLYEYWGNAQATAEALRDGWYHTGDIGTRDADGYFYIHDRKKNMIISGGENIYPAEVERVLHDHPCVAEAAVIGRPDPKWQEVPVAYVVCHKEMSIGAEELRNFVGEHLARFKIPREVVFVDSLPRTALGKVQHFMLRERGDG